MRALRTMVVVAAALAAGCSSKGKAPEKAENPPYVFPHSPHVENGVKCTLCHPGLDDAAKLDPAVRHVKLDAKDKACADCHGDEIAGVKAPKRVKEYRLTFSHADHLFQVDGKCQGCHQKLPEKGDAAAEAPPMSACTGCHNHQKDFDEARCTPCHVDLKAFPLKPLTEFAHKGDFKKTHGALARTSADTCATCHDQTYCVDCHSPATTPMGPALRWPELVERDFIHRGDYVSRHMIEAEANPASCTKCHGANFCESCHRLQGVASLPGTTFTSDRNPHPTGWAGAPHGKAARRNIATCASCHQANAEQLCGTCHNNGPRINPHPPGFDGDGKNKGVCRTCHAAG